MTTMDHRYPVLADSVARFGLAIGLCAVTACSQPKTITVTKDGGTDARDLGDAASLTPDTRSDTAAPAHDGADTALSKDDAGPDGNGANRDAAADKAAREAAADKGAPPPACTGTLRFAGILPLSESWGQNLALGEVNGDGKLDMVSESSVALGKGDGTFAAKLMSVAASVSGFPLTLPTRRPP
jgi:hypothetical protein